MSSKTKYKTRQNIRICAHCGNSWILNNPQSRPKYCSLKCAFDSVPKLINENNCWITDCAKDYDGYRSIMYMSKQYKLHRLAVDLYCQEKLSNEKPMALHSCNNPACCNPDHLRAGTHNENMQDMTKSGNKFILYGENAPSSKLTEKEVILIYNDNRPSIDISKDYPNISYSTILDIKNKRRWKWLTDTL